MSAERRPACSGYHRPRRLARGGRASRPRARYRVEPLGVPEGAQLLCGVHARSYRGRARWKVTPL